MSPLSDQKRARSQYSAGEKRASSAQLRPTASGSKRASEEVNSRSRAMSPMAPVSSQDDANRIPWPLNMYTLTEMETAGAVFHCLVHRGTDCGGSCLLPTASVHSPDAAAGDSEGNSQLSPMASVHSPDAAAGDSEGNSQLSPMASVRSQYAESERASEGNSQLQTSQQRVSAAAALIHELVSNPMAGTMSQQSVASAAALIHELVSVHWFPSGDHEDNDDHHHQAKKAKR